MGFSVDLIAFDHEYFMHKIITSLREGESNPLIATEVGRLTEDYNVIMQAGEINAYHHSFLGLKKVMSTIDDSFHKSKQDSYFAVLKGIIEPVKHAYRLPSKAHWGYEHLSTLFEYITIKYCSKFHLTIGKQYSLVAFFENNILNYDELSNLHSILNQLDSGCNYFQHGNGGFGEGITGWISSSKIKDLHSSLTRIKLKVDIENRTRIRIHKIMELVKIANANNLGLLTGRDLGLNVPNRSGIISLNLNNHISGDSSVNFDGECV